MRVRWSDTEVEVLHKHYARSEWIVLCQLLQGRSRAQIANKANLIGLSRDKTPKISDEERLRRKREGMARRRIADPEGSRAYSRNYHHKNRELNCAKLRDYNTRRFFRSRAMKLSGPGRATAKELAFLWRKQRGRCAITGIKLDRGAQVDHIMPKKRGGKDLVGNLRWVCELANITKRHMTDSELIAFCFECLRHLSIPSPPE